MVIALVGLVMDTLYLLVMMIDLSQRLMMFLLPLSNMMCHRGLDRVYMMVSKNVSEKVSDKISREVSAMASEKLSKVVSDVSQVDSVYSESLRGGGSVTGAKHTRTIYRMFWGTEIIKALNKDKEGKLAAYLNALGPHRVLFSSVTCCLHLHTNNRVNSETYYRKPIHKGSILYCFCRHADLLSIESLLNSDMVDIGLIGALLDRHPATPESCAIKLHELATAGTVHVSLVKHLTPVG
jgi:hypothetical protein